MKLAVVTAALAVSLSGCASYPNIPEPQELLQTVGDMYVGGPVQALAARYGMPHAQQQFQGETVYSWFADTTMQWRRPIQSTTQGQVGDPTQWPWTTVPYRQTTVTNSYESQSYHCRMDVYVKPDGTVRTLGFFGKMGACNEFNPYR